MRKSNFVFTLAITTAMCVATAGQAQTFDHNGITIETGDVKLVIGGRVHLDTVSVSDEITPFKDKTDLRRLRIDGTLSIGDDLRFRLDGDVGGISTGFKNVWVAYSGIKNTTIRGGNFIAPVLGENMKSSNNIKLMERSLASALVSDFLLGGAVRYRRENISITAGYFGNPLSTDDVRPTDDGESVAARVVWAPIRERRRTFFVAAGIEYRQLDTGAVSRTRTIPEFGLLNTRLIDTGSLDGVDSFITYVGEAGFAIGPFMVQGQYINRANDAPTLGDPNFSGGSIQAAFVLTGERQRFGIASGTFGSVRPRSKFGALEIAARVSTLDLNSGLVAGGEETNYTVGLNWYPIRNIRLMVNYVRAKTKPGANGFRESPNTIMGRFQLAF